MLYFDDIPSLHNVIKEASECDDGMKDSVFLVKAHGIYLIAAEPKREASGRAKNITYALGYNPDVDEDWYDSARDLFRGDDFAEALSVSKISTSILDDGADLRIIVTPEHVKVLCGQRVYVPVAEYRDFTGFIFNQAVAHFCACVSKDEFISWRGMAMKTLEKAAFITCRRAREDDYRKFFTACERLQQSLNSVTTDGTIRFKC